MATSLLRALFVAPRNKCGGLGITQAPSLSAYMTQLILPYQTFKDDPDAPWVVEHNQEITDEFLETNKEKRDASSAPSNDYHQLASIPTVVVEKWMREGFNIFDENVTPREIVARLKRENLEAFLTSNKRI
jgi:hypothetical protein